MEFLVVSTYAVKIWDHLNENWLSSYLIIKQYQFFWNTLYNTVV